MVERAVPSPPRHHAFLYILRISQAAPMPKTLPETVWTACEIRKWKRGAAGIIFLVCVETRVPAVWNTHYELD